MTPEEFKKSLIDELPPIRGYIQSYNREKGYGFIKDENKNTYFFHVTCFDEGCEPKVGMKVKLTVSPDLVQLGKHSKASRIWLDEDAQQKHKAEKEKNDSKVVCPHCGKRVLPRMSFFHGTPSQSFCPICGGLIRNFNETSSLGSFIFFVFVMFIIFLIIM